MKLLVQGSPFSTPMICWNKSNLEFVEKFLPPEKFNINTPKQPYFKDKKPPKISILEPKNDGLEDECSSSGGPYSQVLS